MIIDTISLPFASISRFTSPNPLEVAGTKGICFCFFLHLIWLSQYLVAYRLLQLNRYCRNNHSLNLHSLPILLCSFINLVLFICILRQLSVQGSHHWSGRVTCTQPYPCKRSCFYNLNTWPSGYNRETLLSHQGHHHYINITNDFIQICINKSPSELGQLTVTFSSFWLSPLFCFIAPSLHNVSEKNFYICKLLELK